MELLRLINIGRLKVIVIVTYLICFLSKALIISTTPGTIADLGTLRENSSKPRHNTSSPAAAGNVG